MAEPLADSVNIPFGEFAERTHELPPREETVLVAGPADLAERAVAWLREHGRCAVVERDVPRADVADAGHIGRLWRPNAFLQRVAARLDAGAALDLACGCGREAVFLAAGGWYVTAVDRLDDALARARELERRYTSRANAIRWIAADLEAGRVEFGREFDLILGCRYLHRPLFERFEDWLRPGGSVVWETFTTLHRARHGKPAADAHVVNEGELSRLVPGLEIVEASEGWRGEAHTARIWARGSGAGV